MFLFLYIKILCDIGWPATYIYKEPGTASANAIQDLNIREHQTYHINSCLLALRTPENIAKMAQHRYEDYTVCWVCALPIELAAAQAMLDEVHGSFDMYTLGRIGNHNVVIACLPNGQTGISPAAADAVINQMMETFLSIRFGLMVGIGGGAPTAEAEADIRLGDVVISQPQNMNSGVVQYVATSSGFKKIGGFFNRPPTILRSAVSRLEADDMLGGFRIMEILDGFPIFAGPDVLFEADYQHVGGATCELCSRERAVERKPRHAQRTVAHYGTIASGDRDMRDGAERDRASSELGGVLCFETVAASLMVDFPCLVIRGICDYVDSHKDKRWRAYAAVAAAEYAKELLSVIPTPRRFDEIIMEKNCLRYLLNNNSDSRESSIMAE